jgi:PhnB protein
MWLTGQNTHSRVPDMWSANRAERVFAALSDGGRVLMPIQETFFASRFGQVRDRFGINWMILHERQSPRDDGSGNPRL